MEKFKSKWKELKNCLDEYNEKITERYNKHIKIPFNFCISFIFMLVIGIITYFKNIDMLSFFWSLFFLCITTSIILWKFKFCKLAIFDFLVNILFFVICLTIFIKIENIFITFFLYKIIITILLFTLNNSEFKYWCLDFTESKIYLIVNIIFIIFLIYIEYYINIKLIGFLVLILLYLLVPVFGRICGILYRLQFIEFVVNANFLGLCIISIICFNDKKSCFSIFFVYCFVKLIYLIPFYILLSNNVSNRRLYHKNYKIKTWLKSSYIVNLLDEKSFKDFNLSFNIRNELAKENRQKLKYLERKILSKFNSEVELKREKQLLHKNDKKIKKWHKILFNPIVISIVTLLVSDLLSDKTDGQNKKTKISILIDFFSGIIEIIVKCLGNIREYIINKDFKVLVDDLIELLRNILINVDEESFKVYILILLVMLFIFIICFSIILFVIFSIKNKQDRRNYLRLLDYIIDNYDELNKEHRIKRIYLSSKYSKNFINNKKYLKYAIFEYNKINTLNESEINKLKNLFNFFEDVGIQIYIFSRDNKESKIKKYLKSKELDDFEYVIIDKKEIEYSLDYKDKNFIVEFCKKLYISFNECFILVDSDDKNIYYEINSLENDKIVKYTEFFYDLTEMIEFLQSKME